MNFGESSVKSFECLVTFQKVCKTVEQKLQKTCHIY